MKKIKARLIKSHLTHQIRNKVLWPHKNQENCAIKEDLLKETFHVGVFLNEELVSIGTFIKIDNNLFENKHKQYRLRAMGTSKEHQKKSMGEKLILHAKKILITKKLTFCGVTLEKKLLLFIKKLDLKQREIITKYQKLESIN